MLTPRERVKLALGHRTPDRLPVDFLATPEVWEKLISPLKDRLDPVRESPYYDARWESLLRYLEVDCRVLSYDQFVSIPEGVLPAGERIEWWKTLARSTPNRMWRRVGKDGRWYSVWGHRYRIVEHLLGSYEEVTDPPLQHARSVDDLKEHPWPEPGWWDFTPLPGVIEELDGENEYHIRFRIGSVFELAWQLRGMAQFLMDMVGDPDIPRYIMERLTEVHVENTRRVLDLVGDRLDMVYIYDDIAGQDNLLMSKKMWEQQIRPHHKKIIEVAQQHQVPIMYHTDGAAYQLIPDLIDLGIDVLNPIQADAPGMEPEKLKKEFGEQLSFHGGIDIIKTLPEGSINDVRAEVLERKRVLGADGGYIMASSHHIQVDTPLENIFAMYDLELRQQH